MASTCNDDDISTNSCAPQHKGTTRKRKQPQQQQDTKTRTRHTNSRQQVRHLFAELESLLLRSSGSMTVGKKTYKQILEAAIEYIKDAHEAALPMQSPSADSFALANDLSECWTVQTMEPQMPNSMFEQPLISEYPYWGSWS